MRAVFLKELGAFFRGRKGWILLSVLTFLNGLFLSYFHFFLGNTRYEILIGTMMLIVAVLLPIWVVPRFGGSREQGEARLLESLPLKKTEIFGGKLLASVAILLFMMLVMACFSIVMSLFGGANAGYACLALAVAFLLGCAILSGIVFFSVLFRKRLYAWIASYAFVGIFFIGSRIVAGSNGAIGKVFGYLFLFESFSPLSYNLFVWNILPYYLGVALAFFGVSLWILSGLQTKKAILSLGLSLLLLVSTVASAFLPAYARSVDMSEEETMSVSVTTEKYLTTLDSDVTLYLLIDDLSEAPYVDYRFEAFLDRYVSHSDRLTLERIPLSKSGSLLAEFGVSELSASYAYCVVAKSELRSRIVSYTDMLYYIHNDQTLSSIGLPTQFSYTEYDSYLKTLYQYAVSDSTYTEAYYAFLSSPKIHFVGETLLNELIEYVCAEIIPTSYVLTGHGEPDPNGLLLGSLVAGYRALNLSSVEEVPADAAAILLLSPDTDYTAEEIEKLSAYLKRGGNLTVVMDASGSGKPNLMGLFSAYGLTALDGVVREETEKTVKDEEGNETTETVIVDSVSVNINENHDAMAVLSTMIGSDTIKIKGGNAIVFSETEDSSLLTTALLTTGDKAFLTEDGDRGAYVLGAAAETAEGARLVWFTGEKNYLLTMADITVDSEESLFYPTFCPYLGMMWTTLKYTSGVAELPAVLYEEPYLDASGMEFIVFGLVFVLAIPAGLIATGLVKSYKRKKA